MSIPPAFRRLVDDAAIFPPGLAPLADAVVAHAGHAGSGHRDFVGPFVVDIDRLGELAELATTALFPTGLRVSVVVPSPHDLPSAVRTAHEAEHLDLAGLEVKLEADTPVTEQIREIASTQRHGASTYVEAPRPGDARWCDVLDHVVQADLRLKFRTGGTEAGAFPSESELATWVCDAVARAVRFKCTAGLHQAVRHTDAATGFEHHGYLNVLLATARAVTGAEPRQVEAVVAQRDARTLAREVADTSWHVMSLAREAFTSYGSCSILEPLQDLAELHLLSLEADIPPATSGAHQ